MVRPNGHGVMSAHAEPHLSGRTGWLRAAVMGANDGILSTASLLVGVASGGVDRPTLLLAGAAGIAAGALSMAAGEYVSVSSQADAERADMAKERRELRDNPEGELAELTAIYEARGVSPDLAADVAQQLTDHDALTAHMRDEIGLTDLAPPRPVQAATVSAMTFASGAAVPFIVAGLAPMAAVTIWIAVATVVALASLGALGARAGGAKPAKAAIRVVVLGCAAMAATSVIGSLVGAAL